MDRPPCWQDGKKQNPCALAHYERVVHGHTDLRADWLGWKQRGRYLVAPDGQRISPERMRGIMWRLDAEARRDAARARNAKRKVSQGSVKVVVVELADWHARHFATAPDKSPLPPVASTVGAHALTPLRRIESDLEQLPEDERCAPN